MSRRPRAFRSRQHGGVCCAGRRGFGRLRSGSRDRRGRFSKALTRRRLALSGQPQVRWGRGGLSRGESRIRMGEREGTPTHELPGRDGANFRRPASFRCCLLSAHPGGRPETAGGGPHPRCRACCSGQTKLREFPAKPGRRNSEAREGTGGCFFERERTACRVVWSMSQSAISVLFPGHFFPAAAGIGQLHSGTTSKDPSTADGGGPGDASSIRKQTAISELIPALAGRITPSYEMWKDQLHLRAAMKTAGLFLW